MKPPRRGFLQIAAGAATALAPVWRPAWAQTYPSRPVHLIVGFPAGGQVDIVARLMGRWLAEHLGQPFVIENRTGAGGNIATEAVIRAPADGHTLLFASASVAVNATLFDGLSYDFIRDTVPVASINRIPLVLEVHPSFPAKTVPELIAYARANPGKLDIATPSSGTAPYMAAELFKMMGQLDIVHVPYRGSPQMLTDLLAGQVQVAFDGISTSIAHIQAGKLRALAATTAAPVEALPGIPTVSDTVPGYEASGWCGIVAPKGTPVGVIDKLAAQVNTALADSTVRARLADAGVTVLSGSPAEFAGFIAEETEKWGKVVRLGALKPE